MTQDPSRYAHYSRKEWSALRAATPLSLEEADLEAMRGINERLDLAEVSQIYLPLSRLLNLHVAATQKLSQVTATFIGALHEPVPYIIGLAGSVAVGKSTTARILQALLARWPNHPRVDLVTTDGFLHPNRELEKRDMMLRKGFPESYDQAALISFLAKLKAGVREVAAPVYSHTKYDVIPGKTQIVSQPDVLIIEGLNVLQTGRPRASNDTSHSSPPQVFVSDFFDFGIYVDAQEEYVEEWYVERFLTLCDTVFKDERSFFRRYADLSTEEATAEAHRIWRSINAPNLHRNIAPTRERADLILVKARDHSVEEVRLRKT